MAERLTFDSQAARHVQAYIDYVNLVGNDDGGKLMTEKEFEAYKKNIAEKSKNRIYCSWKNSRGVECKMIGPATKCFCNHRFKDHEYLQPKNKKPHCKQPKCSCPAFYYIPVHGSQDFKCLCKHSHQLHDPITKKCSMGQCGCNKFSSTWSCSCGAKFGEHTTTFETRDERIAQGKPVDDMSRLTNELNAPLMNGGLMNFQQLVTGADRYEQQINALGNGNQNALEGYPEVKAIKQPPKQPDSKQKRLQNLNKHLKEESKVDMYGHDQDPENQFSQFNQQDDDNDSLSEAVKKMQISNQQPKGKTAFELFNTPHLYQRVKMLPYNKFKR